MSECLVYQLKYGRTIVCNFRSFYELSLITFQVGRLDSDKPAAIRLSGENILEEHCYIDNNDGVVTLTAPTGSITVGHMILFRLLLTFSSS